MSDNFKTDTLDSLCELIVDCPHSTPTWTTFGYVVIRNQNITDGVLDLSSPSYTDYSGYRDRTKRASPQENDIVITREAPMGRVCLIPKEPICCLGQRQVLLRADRNKISAEYLYWSLRSSFVQRQILINEGTGATVSNMRIPVLKALEIPRLASIEIENKKARDLSNIQNKIQLNTQINQTLEQIAQALFKSWFVDFDPVRAKVQALSDGLSIEQAELAAMQAISGKTPEELTALSQAEPDRYAELAETAKAFPCEMVEVDGVEMPKGWEYCSFGDVSECFDSKRIPLSKQQREKRKGNIPYYGATSVMDYVDEAIFDDIYLLVGEDGSVLKEDGTPFTQYIWGKSWVNNHAHILKGRNGISTEHLMIFIQQTNISAYITGAVQLKLNQKNMNSIPFLRANNAINAFFAEYIESLYAKIRKNFDENKVLEATRDLLLPKLLSGNFSNGKN
ncbi:restriction endonuclease subunit S [Haemophilus sputorum]|uniref:restriction endonuclease subunit S n=1 Tax=Haemophilus sputorum TaxID=1078480 RepID=UPI0002488714|nr:restriction endonuclease subunit S [Haemophilus sputorum]